MLRLHHWLSVRARYSVCAAGLLWATASAASQQMPLIEFAKESSSACTTAYDSKNYLMAFLKCSAQVVKGEGKQAYLVGKMFEEGKAPASTDTRTGKRHEKGTPVPEEAYVWYMIGETQGNKDAASARAVLEKNFSEKEKQKLALKAEETECNLIQATQSWHLGDKCRGMAEQGSAGAKNAYTLWEKEHVTNQSLAAYEKAANTGDISAQLYLGDYYLTHFHETGKVYSAKRYVDKAISWFQKAADAGNPDAQAKLGVIYSTANIENTDISKIRTAIIKPDGTRTVLEDGDAGIDNTIHTSLERDMDKAIEWFTKAALQGDARAQLSLGLIYLQDKDIPRNYEQAYKWMLLANNEKKAANPLVAQSLQFLEKEASKDELARGHEAAEIIQKTINK